MKSIMQDERICLLCGTDYNIQEHHCLRGSNRKMAEKYGLKVYLCQEHHTGATGVHNNRQLEEALKQMAQRKFEETHTRDEFMSIFGRNYLD